MSLSWEPERKIFSVSELNARIRSLLDEEFGDVWVAGRYTVWWYDGRVWRNFRMPVSVEETTA